MDKLRQALTSSNRIVCGIVQSLESVWSCFVGRVICFIRKFLTTSDCIVSGFVQSL